jgi:Holliday junction resolvasome RuvABC ATP-dependent DNA helicase subunit
MDSGQYVIMIATNEVGLLKDPLVNRCTYVYTFEPYTTEELREMAENLFNERGRDNVNPEFFDSLVTWSGGVPRILRNLVNRFDVVFKTFTPTTTEELVELAEGVLNLDERGFDAQDRRYIRVLEDYGRCSLSLISAATGLTKETIQKYIEPKLIGMRVIRISSRGRELV